MTCKSTSSIYFFYQYFVSNKLESTDFFEHPLEFSFFVELDNTPHWTIVATSNKFLSDPNGWDRCSANEVAHLRSNSLAIWIGVQLDHGVLGIHIVQNTLGLDAKGTGREREHQYGIVVDESVGSSLDGFGVVLTRQGLDEIFLCIIEETKYV